MAVLLLCDGTKDKHKHKMCMQGIYCCCYVFWKRPFLQEKAQEKCFLCAAVMTWLLTRDRTLSLATNGGLYTHFSTFSIYSITLLQLLTPRKEVLIKKSELLPLRNTNTAEANHPKNVLNNAKCIDRKSISMTNFELRMKSCAAKN